MSITGAKSNTASGSIAGSSVTPIVMPFFYCKAASILAYKFTKVIHNGSGISIGSGMGVAMGPNIETYM